MRQGILLLFPTVLLIGATSTTRADSYLLRGASQATIDEVLYPWTQGDDCGECCVCWESALATILAYWDDYGHDLMGPWENLYWCGNGGSENGEGFAAVTGSLYLASDVECGSGAGTELDWWSIVTYDAVEAAETYTNDLLGYAFSYDFDELVWWEWDITDYIDEDIPVYFGGSPWEPGGSEGHAVTVVGYDDEGEVLYLYDNHHAWLTSRMFDDFADNRRTIDIVPGGTAPVPAGWSCDAGYYATRDGCDCECGEYDPDCDDPGQELYNCSDLQYCSCQGLCQDLCTPSCAGRVCGDDGCGGSCGSCEIGEHCTANGRCEPDCVPSCDGRVCGDDGCGGSCGSCAVGEHCTAAGRCEPDCVPSCTGRECGDDGCGGSCGSCAVGEHCTAAGRCEPDCVPSCTSRECGDDGCGGLCGTCDYGEYCTSDGTCLPGCESNCGGRECGDDGCGGSCGQCPAGQRCSDNYRCLSDGTTPPADQTSDTDEAGCLCGFSQSRPIAGCLVAIGLVLAAFMCARRRPVPRRR